MKMKSALKIVLILIVNFIYAHPLYAKSVEQKEFNFKVQSEALLKGGVHYSFNLVTPKKFLENFPEAYDLDTLATLQEKKVRIMLTKTIYIVNKPVGFFDHENMKEERFLSHLMGEQKVKKTAKDSVIVSVPGETAHTYKLKTYFDSDDISTLPSSRIIQAVTTARKLDVISQSASSIVLREYSDFSKYSVGGTSVHSYIPLKEGKTLVISYHLMAVKKNFAIENVLKSGFLKETEAVQGLIDSYVP